MPTTAHATAGFCGTQASTIASLSQRHMATWAVEACFSQPRPWACSQMCLRVRFWENSAGPFFVDELSRLGPEPAISSFGIRSWNNAEDFKCCFKVFVEALKCCGVLHLFMWSFHGRSAENAVLLLPAHASADACLGWRCRLMVRNSIQKSRLLCKSRVWIRGINMNIMSLSHKP